MIWSASLGTFNRQVSRYHRRFSSTLDSYLAQFVNHEARGVPAGAGTESKHGFDLVCPPTYLIAVSKPRQQWPTSATPASILCPSIILHTNSVEYIKVYDSPEYARGICIILVTNMNTSLDHPSHAVFAPNVYSEVDLVSKYLSSAHVLVKR